MFGKLVELEYGNDWEKQHFCRVNAVSKVLEFSVCGLLQFSLTFSCFLFEEIVLKYGICLKSQ